MDASEAQLQTRRLGTGANVRVSMRQNMARQQTPSWRVGFDAVGERSLNVTQPPSPTTMRHWKFRTMDAGSQTSDRSGSWVCFRDSVDRLGHRCSRSCLDSLVLALGESLRSNLVDVETERRV